IRGLAYLGHEMYYTRAGSNSLYARGFLADSGILRETTRTVAGFNEPNVGELFFDDSGEHLYFTNTSTGELSRIGWDGDGPRGTAKVVSGPGVDDMDWRSRALFLADGPPPAGANEPPVAKLDSDCDGLECAFDGSGSQDPDGSIASYEWDFGDGDTASGASVEHTYDAAGDYSVTLTVTDDRGATARAVSEVQVEQGTAAGQPELVGVSAGQAHSSRVEVPVPDGVQEGDTIMAFLTAGDDGAVAGPSGVGDWALEEETFLAPMAVRLYSHVADGSEAGKTLTVSSDHLVKWDLTVVAYRGTGGDPV